MILLISLMAMKSESKTDSHIDNIFSMYNKKVAILFLKFFPVFWVNK